MNIDSILITPVANGYVVELPEVEKPENPLDMSAFTTAIDTLKGLFGGDPILDKVKNQERLAQAESLLSKIQQPLAKRQGTHIFKTFPEVLTFLSEQFPE